MRRLFLSEIGLGAKVASSVYVWRNANGTKTGCVCLPPFAALLFSYMKKRNIACTYLVGVRLCSNIWQLAHENSQTLHSPFTV